METKEIQFKAEDFKDAAFSSNCDCPLARATKRATGNNDVIVTPLYTTLSNKYYTNEPYFGKIEFDRVQERFEKNPEYEYSLSLIPRS